MIAKGNLHDGGKLAAYLVTGKPGERAELALMEGFAASDLRDAFRDVEIQARATKARFPFFPPLHPVSARRDAGRCAGPGAVP